MGHILKKILLPFLLTLFCISFGQKNSSTTPVIQAQFPGGQKALAKYIMTNVSDKATLSDDGTPVEKVIAKFYVDEHGKTSDAKIVKTSRHQNIDKLLIEVIYAMPKWTPAENPKGKKVRQEITIPLYICAK